MQRYIRHVPALQSAPLLGTGSEQKAEVGPRSQEVHTIVGRTLGRGQKGP